MNQYSYVYMLASQRNGTLYIGVTTDLQKRAWQHKNKFAEGFSNDHNIDKLVWFEQHETIEAAITREKQMKKWRRAWNLLQIEGSNPYWNDLYEDLTT